MSLPADQVDELRLVYPRVMQAEEAGLTYVLIPGLKLGASCRPSETDGLLCPSSKDGYASRLFLAHRIEGVAVPNWTSWKILARDWWAYSWQGIDAASHRLLQMVGAHLRPLL